MKVQLFYGSCLNILPTQPQSSVDLILADLPYGTTACKWDSILPLMELWKLYQHILKPMGCVVMTCAQPFTTILASSKLEWLRYEWIWEKPQGTNPLNAKSMPMKAHENILVFAPKRAVYNPQMESGFTPIRGFSSDNALIGEVYGTAKSIHRDNPEGTRYPTSVLRYRTDQDGFHPTQKPVALMRYLIRTHSNVGDTVLDNVMGSGTTGVAAIQEGRSFIGIELEDKYFAIAVERIQNNHHLFNEYVTEVFP